MSTPLAELPGGGSEREMLVAFLDYYRAVIRRKAEGLDAEALRRTLAPSDLTLGGLLAHLAYVEDFWFGERLHGRTPSKPWDTAPWSEDADWDWRLGEQAEPAEIFALYDAACAQSRRELEQVTDLDAPLAQPGPDALTVRWMLVHMVEEYARHAGHADFLRQAIDGATGD